MASEPSTPPDERTQDDLRAELGCLLPPEPRGAIDLDALFAGVKVQLEAERGPRAWLRARPTAVRVGAMLAAVLLLVATVVSRWPRADRDVYPAERMGLSLLVIGGLIGLELLLALRPLQRPALPAWFAPAALASAIAGLLGLCALPPAHLNHPASLHAPGFAALVTHALPCLGIGLTIALGCYALLRAADRGGAWHALLAAACAGLVANLTLQLHCPITAPRHLLAAHVSVALLLLGITALRRGRA